MFACFDACLVALTEAQNFSIMTLDGKSSILQVLLPLGSFYK
jgi:hypothetical protein